jgi:hypothetical protein
LSGNAHSLSAAQLGGSYRMEDHFCQDTSMNLTSRFKCKLIALLSILGGCLVWSALAILIVMLAKTIWSFGPSLVAISGLPSSPLGIVFCVVPAYFLIAYLIVMFVVNLLDRIEIDRTSWWKIQRRLLEPVGACVNNLLEFSYARDPHKWGDDWEYERPKDCTQVKMCRRCGHRQQRVSHDWDLGDRDHWPCERVATCRRCGKTDMLGHSFSWKHVQWDDSTDYDEYSCDRCGKVEEPL